MAHPSFNPNWRSRVPFNASVRNREWQSLGDSQDPWDLVIVGGGITGAAVARDAAARNLKTLLVEKDDFASGTSSRSSKLVHGGVRYLEQLEFKLVMESTRERGLLWKHAKHLVQPLQFVFPTFEHSRVPLWKLSLGLWLYDLLALFRSPGLHKTLSVTKTLNQESTLGKKGLRGSVIYWDAATDDAKLTLANIIDARSLGAICLARVVYESSQFQESAQLHTVCLRDQITGHSTVVKSRALVMAGGPWTDQLLQKSPWPDSKQLMKATRGSHLVVPRAKLPVKNAVVLFHPVDQRVLFAIPWGPSTVIGTTDIIDKQSPETVRIEPDEVKYLLDAALFYFPAHPLTPRDVISTWSGLRPLVAPPSDVAQGASDISRDHYIKSHEPRIFVVTGGKLTTHREMAEQTLNLYFDQASGWKDPPRGGERRCITGLRPLPPLHSATPLSSEADFELLFQTQCVLSLEDFFVRRTDFFYHLSDHGLSLLPQLKQLFIKHLSWTEMDFSRSLEAYIRYINRNVQEPLGRQPLSFKS